MAWKRQKPEMEVDGEPAAPAPRDTAAPAGRESTVTQKVINLGKTIQIKGDLTGSEDLTIEGKLEGKILIENHQLTIGENGQIKADIEAKGVLVVGNLVGNITAGDRVEVAAAGSVVGDIRAPRVILADGATFRGSIDMQPVTRANQAATTAPSTAATPAKSGSGAKVTADRPRATV